MIEAGSLLVGYLLGSVSGSLLLGRLRGVDIRTQGSGNAGGTNALRTQGIGFALGVVIIDVGKGALAAWLGSLAAAPPAASWWIAGAAIAAILGHMFPLYFGFRGGKGGATYLGAVAVMAPLALLPILLGWLVVAVITGYVGLSTMIASIVGAGAIWWLASPEQAAAFGAFGLAAAALIVTAHRANIQRHLDGVENRFERLRISHWGRRKS